ncbi:MAG: DUF4105 domain-containing protein [Pseudomonadota bacterium]
MRLVLCFLACVLGLSAGVFAATPTVPELARSQSWLLLNKYKPNVFSSTGVESAILEEGFFLSERGRYDPVAELGATLTALRNLPSPAAREVACRYPARTLFLREALGTPAFDPYTECPEFAAFLPDGDVDQVTLVLVSGYVGNPASIFGHLLLRFSSSSQERAGDELFSTAINYGAFGSEGDPILAYVANGLLGRYQSRHTTLDYFHHVDRYLELEQRDIWEYDIALGREKALFFAAHMWEMLPTSNDYYFLRQNCGYRIAEPLQLVLDPEIPLSTKPWVAPADLIFNLFEHHAEVISDVRHRPARETAFRERFLQLPYQARSAVGALTQGDAPVEVVLGGLSEEESSAALDVSLDRLAYTTQRDDQESRQREVLSARFQRPAAERLPVRVRPSPHEGQGISLLQAGVGFGEDADPRLLLRARPAYFDFLSFSEGTNDFSEVTALDGTLSLATDGVRLEAFQAMRIKSIDLEALPENRFAPRSWLVDVGFDRRSSLCEDCLSGYLDLGAGSRIFLSQTSAVTAFLEARSHSTGPRRFEVDVGPSLDVMRDFSGVRLRSRLFVPAFSSEGEAFAPVLEADVAYRLSRQNSLELGARYDDGAEVQLRVSRYW